MASIGLIVLEKKIAMLKFADDNGGWWQKTQWPKEKEQTTQWPKEKIQKEKQWSTNLYTEN